MVSRVMENKLVFKKSIEEGENELMKRILINMEEDRTSEWVKRVRIYERRLNITRREWINISKKQIKEIVKKYDAEEWEKILSRKKMARVYWEKKRKR